MSDEDLDVTSDPGPTPFVPPIPESSKPAEKPDRPVHTPKADKDGKVRYGKRGKEKGIEPKPIQCSIEVFIPGSSWQCLNPHLPGNTLCADHAR